MLAIMRSVDRIFEVYPKIKHKIENPLEPSLVLTNEEYVFYQLVLFFKKPKKIQFSLNMIYEYLKDEDLIFALEMLIEYFQKDTELVRNVSQSFYSEQLKKEQLVGQKKFSVMVESAIPGVKFPPAMVHTYWKRNNGKIPGADLIIDQTPYWTEKTVAKFIEEKKMADSNKRKK
ncbi:hypothetical protein [Bacillus sp. JJ722]|uniref:hypothetical protein n=1 Tax=Bacillus sp. JJ722 TaxID=3122973 RepID=UPI002FFF562A